MLETLVAEQQIYAKFQHLQKLGNTGRELVTPEDAILVERKGPVATVTINRPHVRNALDMASWMALTRSFQNLGEDAAVRAVVLRGGGHSFCAGADVAEIQRFADALEGNLGLIRAVASDYFSIARYTMSVMDRSPFVVIAQMEGPALGIGNILALACDRRIADTSVVTGVPAGVLGIMLDPRELWRLVVHVGKGNANKIIFSGDRYGSQDSLRMGQVDTVVEPGEIERTVQAEVTKAARQSRGAIVTAKNGFGLIAGTPGFRDSDVTLDTYYQWVDHEAVRRMNTFLRRRTSE